MQKPAEQMKLFHFSLFVFFFEIVNFYDTYPISTKEFVEYKITINPSSIMLYIIDEIQYFVSSIARNNKIYKFSVESVILLKCTI